MNNCSPWIHEIYQGIFEICTDLGILVANAKYAQKYTVAYTRFFAQCEERLQGVIPKLCFEAMVGQRSKFLKEQKDECYYCSEYFQGIGVPRYVVHSYCKRS